MSHNLARLFYLCISLHSSCGEVFDFISQGCTTRGVNTLNVSLIQNALWSWQVLGWSGFLELDILKSLFTTTFFSPILTEGDNASWVENIDFSFLLSRSLFPLPRWRFNVLSFSHFYIFFSLLCLLFSLPLSPYFPLYIPHATHTYYLSLLFFLRSRCSGRDSQCSTICGDRWRSGTAGFHRHLCPHCHHLVLCPTER